jgi:hypothetical protein
MAHKPFESDAHLNRRRFQMGRFHRPFGNFIGHNLENQNGRRSILILQGFNKWANLYMRDR